MSTLVLLKKNIDTELKKVNQIIQQTLLSTNIPTLSKIYEHILLTKGKQIRASLIILIAKSTNKSNESIYKLAAGIELIHLASLIHDDIIDEADIRRNQDTVHKRFNTNNGIISGVHCYALALKLITSIENLDVLNTISNAVIELCEGESFQVNERHNFSLTRDDYWQIVEKKTSALFKATCISAGQLIRINESDIEHLSNFGHLIGDIFQLADDYLDIFDDKNELSKKIMQDLSTGDISLPILLASEKTINKTPEEIKMVLAKEKNHIATTIKHEIASKKEAAEKNLNELSFNPDQIHTVLKIITKRILN
ncbi:hypothetical protein DID73_01165 [Candidatus Marinamargulisbacteria bacterium SCGC AG-343-K17]|nr:hypothetical protein DID73_01165 [Candidatus Marinamargulisbacteria bacterium SCGC AG-343-K17]